MLSELFRKRAATPYSLSWSTWSFIREMSGETTIVRPSEDQSGDLIAEGLAPPVGMTTRASFFSRM